MLSNNLEADKDDLSRLHPSHSELFQIPLLVPIIFISKVFKKLIKNLHSKPFFKAGEKKHRLHCNIFITILKLKRKGCKSFKEF